MAHEQHDHRSPIPRRWMKRRAFSSFQGIRVDRRSGIDRRRADRRSIAMAISPERRSGLERRVSERRGGVDRRAPSDRRTLIDRRSSESSLADVLS